MQVNSIQLFENIMSPQKETREKAEKDLDQLKTLPLNQSLPVFAEAMNSTQENIFQLSTLLLKKSFLDDLETLNKLSGDDKQNLINLLKSKIDFSGAKSWKSLQRIGEAIAPLYQSSNMQGGFVDILQWFNDTNSAVSRKFAIFIIEVLCNINAINEDVLDDNAVNNFKEIFKKGLNDVDIDVKVSTLNSVTQFLINILNEGTLLKFNELTENMLDALVATLKYENEKKVADIEESKGKKALETMNEIIDQHPKFWKGKADLIINIVNEISKGKIFANEIRECALELVYSLAKNAHSAIKKSEVFKTVFLNLLFNLMKEVDNENNLEQWEKNIEESEDDFDEMFYGVRDSFERLSTDLGGDFFMSLTADYIKNYLKSQNWIEVHAAYTAMAFMSEGCKESYEKNIKELLEYISTGLVHSHSRVRYAALFAFGMILKTTAPKPQKQFASNILPGLAKLMSDAEPSIRVKTQSCNALTEFLRGLLNEEDEESNTEEGKKIIAPYSADLVKLLSTLFEYSIKVSYYPLQESTLGAISLLSNLLEKDFAPYYDQLMPGFKKLFSGLDAKSSEQKKLKSNTIEAMSFLCSSIAEEREKYAGDLKEISEAFLTYMQQLPEEDPQLTTIINSFTHLSFSMKDQFKPILDKLLPILLKYISADIGFKAEDAALGEYIPEDEELKTDINKGGVQSFVLNLGVNSTKLSLHTFALQVKNLSFNTLYQIANNMEKSFADYVKVILDEAKKYLEFPYSRKIRKLSVKMFKAALNACPNESDKKKVLDIMGDDLLKALDHATEKSFFKDVKNILKNLTLAFENIEDKTNFSEKFIGGLYGLFGKVCKKIDDTKNAILADLAKRKVDEDEEEQILEEYDGLSEIERRVMEVSGVLFKLFGEPITALVAQSLYESFLNNWNNNLKRESFKSDQEVLSSICFFDDFMEFGDIIAVKMFVPSFIENTSNYATENEDVLQSIVFGYGVIAKKLDQNEFKQYNQTVIGYIAKIMQREVNEDNGKTYDNAVSSMGKYIIYQCPNDANSLNMSKQFIKLLPLKYDDEEGKAVAKELFMQIKKNHPLIVNDNTLNELKQSLAEIKKLNDEKKFLEEEETNLNEILAKYGL